jgi:hypothetical protein
MITNTEKCHHIFEFVMSSRVCKRCGLIERNATRLFEKQSAKQDQPKEEVALLA